VQIERSGHDVVKRTSKLNVEEKASDSPISKKGGHKKEDRDGKIMETAEATP
jgi:hypothetical protein